MSFFGGGVRKHMSFFGGGVRKHMVAYFEVHGWFGLGLMYLEIQVPSL